MRINTNVSALQAHQNLSRTNAAAQDSMTKLSSGFRINKAGDDAAGLSIANNLRTNVRSLTQASRNIEQAQSLLQIAEGAGGSIQKIVERMKELAVQAATDTNASQRPTLDDEFQTLKAEISRIAESTEFQGTKLINGSFTERTLQIGAGNSANEQLQVGLGDLRSLGLGSASLTNLANAQSALGSIDGTARQAVTTGSVALGATAIAATDSTAFTVTVGSGSPVTINFGAQTGGWTREQVVERLNAESGGAFTASLNGSNNLVFRATMESGNIAVTSPAADATATPPVVNILGTATQSEVAATNGALKDVNSVLSAIGAYQNRLDYAQTNVKTAIVNISAAESVIRDVDMAEEMSKFSKSNILAQAGTAMLAQANQSSQNVLQLLRG